MTKILKKDRKEPIDTNYSMPTRESMKMELEKFRDDHGYDVNEMLREASEKILQECREDLGDKAS